MAGVWQGMLGPNGVRTAGKEQGLRVYMYMYIDQYIYIYVSFFVFMKLHVHKVKSGVQNFCCRLRGSTWLFHSCSWLLVSKVGSDAHDSSGKSPPWPWKGSLCQSAKKSPRLNIEGEKLILTQGWNLGKFTDFGSRSSESRLLFVYTRRFKVGYQCFEICLKFNPFFSEEFSDYLCFHFHIASIPPILSLSYPFSQSFHLFSFKGMVPLFEFNSVWPGSSLSSKLSTLRNNRCVPWICN